MEIIWAKGKIVIKSKLNTLFSNDPIFFNFIFKGEEVLRSGNKYTLDHQSGVLNINSISQSADEGVYTCTVRDRQGHTARREFTLDVVGKSSIEMIQCHIGCVMLSSQSNRRERSERK